MWSYTLQNLGIQTNGQLQIEADFTDGNVVIINNYFFDTFDQATFEATLAAEVQRLNNLSDAVVDTLGIQNNVGLQLLK